MTAADDWRGIIRDISPYELARQLSQNDGHLVPVRINFLGTERFEGPRPSSSRKISPSERLWTVNERSLNDGSVHTRALR